mmetsp:Transcript_3695/g.9620  ORF Transcript_3695/g.9620 Transcript_3695/m.9620 type:complete len:82 (+) Transcript_3695:460-705(+)
MSCWGDQAPTGPQPAAGGAARFKASSLLLPHRSLLSLLLLEGHKPRESKVDMFVPAEDREERDDVGKAGRAGELEAEIEDR